SYGLLAHVAILQMGHVSYAMIIFMAILGYFPVEKVALLNRKVYEYSEEITKGSETLEKIIYALSHVLGHQTIKLLVFEIHNQLNYIIHDNLANHNICSVIAKLDNGKWNLLSQKGDCHLNDVLHHQKQYQENDRLSFNEDSIVMYFTHNKNLEYMILLKHTGTLSDNTKRFIEIYDTCVYAAYNNLRLNQEIIVSQENIIYALGNVTEGRSHTTGQHIQRVTEFSKYLALQYGMDEKEAEVVKIASAMHDIGKIGIPDSILNKPARLTDEEFKIMKQHTTIGYTILSESSGELIQASAIIALQHHEKFGGNGYPSGISGDKIHIYARIVSIADVFDALLSERPYKKPWTIDEVVAYFKAESGTQFDPELVDLFLAGVEDFIKIRSMFPDSGADERVLQLP
ncbi:MAG: HD domain-containing phosphohydrolase, partial [Saezia sp.]